LAGLIFLHRSKCFWWSIAEGAVCVCNWFGIFFDSGEGRWIGRLDAFPRSRALCADFAGSNAFRCRAPLVGAAIWPVPDVCSLAIYRARAIPFLSLGVKSCRASNPPNSVWRVSRGPQNLKVVFSFSSSVAKVVKISRRALLWRLQNGGFFM